MLYNKFGPTPDVAGTPDLNEQWNPESTHVCTLPQIRAWFDAFGDAAFYSGNRWRLTYKRLCPGRYKVQFKIVKSQG